MTDQSKIFKTISIFLTGMSLFASFAAYAHGGESHGSSPVASSSSKFGNTVENEKPLAVGFKFRSGYEFGQFTGALPSLNSYVGNDEVNLNMNYEFQIRQFNSDQASELPDRDYNNHLTGRAKKVLSDSVDFSLTGEYEKREASRLSRMINDYDYTGVNSGLTYKLKNDWSVTGAVATSSRHYPNGTYLIPSSSPTGAGEPIIPGSVTPATSEITLKGVTDTQNEMSVSLGGELGSQTVSFEGRYIANDSDLATRKYNSQALKLAFEKMLWSRILAQVSYSIENRNFSESIGKISTTELGLQKELSARTTLSALARNNENESVSIRTSSWEGYAQLQYVF